MTEVEAHLKLKDGTEQMFSVQCTHDLPGLVQGIVSVQAQLNDALSALVEQERSEQHASLSGRLSNNKEGTDDEEDEDDSSEDCDEPTEKKPCLQSVDLLIDTGT